MRAQSMPPLSPAVLQRVARLMESGASSEAVLSDLRGYGVDKLDSIRVVREAMKVSLSVAKEIVHTSATWADARESDDAFHDSLLAAAQSLDSENVKAAIGA